MFIATKTKLLTIIGAACLLLLYVSGGWVAAASLGNVSHGYAASDTLPEGSLVSAIPAKSGAIELASTDNAAQLLGVVVDVDTSLVAVESTKTQAQAQVATNGRARVLVSTLTGSIRAGDQIAVSSIEGVGAKAKPGDHVIGIAQSSFSAASSGATTQSLTDATGQTTQVSVGAVLADIAAGSATTDSAERLNGIQKVAKSLSGRTVPTYRILLSLLVAVISFGVLVSLVYGAIYAGIISIGRNPLAKIAVFRTLSAVLLMVLALAALAVAMIIFLLH